MLQAYRTHVAERAALGIPPLPLSASQTADLIELLKNPQPLASLGEEAALLELLAQRVPAGVDDATKVKASYRFFWQILERAYRTGSTLPQEARAYFDAPVH